MVFPRGKQRSQASPEMPHVQVAGHESHEDEVPPPPLSRRVVCGSVHGAANQNAPTQRKRVAFKGGAPGCLRLHGDGVWRA